MASIEERVQDLIESQSDYGFINIYRAYDSYEGAESIEDSDGFNEVLSSLEPLEIAKLVWRSDDFDPYAEYFLFSEYNDYVMCFDSESEVVDYIKSYWLDNVVDFVIEYPEEVDLPGLDEILSDEDE